MQRSYVRHCYIHIIQFSPSFPSQLHTLATSRYCKLAPHSTGCRQNHSYRVEPELINLYGATYISSFNRVSYFICLTETKYENQHLQNKANIQSSWFTFLKLPSFVKHLYVSRREFISSILTQNVGQEQI